MFKKKIIGLFLLFTMLILVLSCDNNAGDTDEKNGYTFIDQDLKGVFSGSDWTFVSGLAKDGFSDNTVWAVNLYNIEPKDGDPLGWMPYFGLDSKKIMFDIPKELGLKTLNTDLTGNSENYTVTFYDSETNKNYITGNGAVEVTEIDIVNNTVSGRMDVWYSGDSDNFHVTGNFTVPFKQ